MITAEIIFIKCIKWRKKLELYKYTQVKGPTQTTHI